MYMRSLSVLLIKLEVSNAPHSHSKRRILQLIVLWRRWLLVVGRSRSWIVAKQCVGGLWLRFNTNRKSYILQKWCHFQWPWM